jgi:hypothetical protein
MFDNYFLIIFYAGSGPTKIEKRGRNFKFDVLDVSLRGLARFDIRIQIRIKNNLRS